MFERPRAGERTLLVRVDLGDAGVDDLEEFMLLARSAGAEVVGVVQAARRVPEPRWFIGAGKAEEIAARVVAEDVGLVLFDRDLTPSQERNLERLFECRVIDRSGLILDIFAQRARSHEGKLQVELAQLRHLSTRLVRGWTHLERQKGGIGLRGPGETQLETDRRLIGKRIALLKRRLEKVTGQRGQGRRARARNGVPTVSLVGYTNAGKSSLFNRLTAAGIYTADQLFATLDPTLRRLDLPDGGHAVLADTVGFIQRLPHDLVAAFRSTLEETVQAALILHVVDAAAPERRRRIGQVEAVLQEIGASGVPRLEVFNKLDLVPDQRPRIERDDQGRPLRVWLSARDGQGIDLFLAAVAERLDQGRVRRDLCLDPHQGRLRARLYREGRVLYDKPLEAGGWAMGVDLARADLTRLEREEGVLADWPEQPA